MHSARRLQGFTLVELMIVVAIIGILTVAIAPGVRRTIIDRKAALSMRELVRFARRARLEATSTLQAHMVWVDTAIDRVQLLRGDTSSCLAQGWQAIQTTCGVSRRRCIEDFDLREPANNLGFNFDLQVERLGGGLSDDRLALCYAPGGVLYSGASLAGPLSDINNQGGAYMITLQVKTVTDEVISPLRRALFPMGATPRLVR